MNTVRCSAKKITIAAVVACSALGLTGCQPFDHYAADPVLTNAPIEPGFEGQLPLDAIHEQADVIDSESVVTTSAAGCPSNDLYAPCMEPPREKAMRSLPSYQIEPPDVLMIEILKLIPKPPYHCEVYDHLRIQVMYALPEQPIDNYYMVDNEGFVDLGPAYGKVKVVGMTIDEITDAITEHLLAILKDPIVSVSLARAAGISEITIPQGYPVGSDGRINLRHYGTLEVAGMTVSEATEALEKHLSQFFDSPEASINIIGYNSKNYYVVTQGAGMGDQMVAVPVTGGDTVLDAISHIGGLSQMSSKNIFIARPAPGNVGRSQILPVDWDAITREGSTAMNYQMMPEDRLFIAEDKVMRLTNFIATTTAPFERLVGFATFTTSSIRAFQTTGRNYNRNRRQ